MVGERKKQYTVVRVSLNGAPMPGYKGLRTNTEGSKLAPVSSRGKGNSNESQVVMRLPTGGRYQRTGPLTRYAPKRARGTRRDKEETHSLTRHGGSKFRSHTSQTIPTSLCTGNIVPPGYKGKSRKAQRNSLVTRLLQIRS